MDIKFGNSIKSEGNKEKSLEVYKIYDILLMMFKQYYFKIAFIMYIFDKRQ